MEIDVGWGCHRMAEEYTKVYGGSRDRLCSEALRSCLRNWSEKMVLVSIANENGQAVSHVGYRTTGEKKTSVECRKVRSRCSPFQTRAMALNSIRQQPWKR